MIAECGSRWNLPAANIIVRIAAGIKPDQFKSLMKVKSDGICIAGLCFKDYRTAPLVYGNFFCLIHKSSA